ncbi:MAG: hypothetical protein R3219_09665, partial [Hydrogenovibrio sp.]|nr:hypothetical protein [Hydrogenovibrio sp.]
MSNQIKQIQANYHPVEDRILFKIHTDNQQIFQAWITRRYLKLLMPVLQGQHPETGKPLMTDSENTSAEEQSSEEIDTTSSEPTSES